ncbi:MAG TPA: TRAP transporter substrate-binding protein [Hyphomicrobiaceae bacterium]|jgi:TRAP-type mannitol/chloroaromatic compound transport system substrate-binding protein
MKNSKISKRDFLRKSILTGAGTVGATTLAAPYVKSQTPIKWRLQTYAGPALAEHVCKPGIDAFNKAANGEMVIEMYTADQLVPQGELFRAVQAGTIDAAQSDDDSAAAPVDVAVFGAYFPFASRYSLDVPVLWHWYGLNKIWEEAYGEVPGVTWLSAGAWDPCNFATTKPIRSIKDLEGLRIYMFPTGGRFMQRFGVVPVSLPYEDVQVAIQTGELDGVCWCGATETYTVGWADVTKYYLTNNISGAWSGSYFANTDKWNALPEHLKTLFRMSMDTSHYYRQHWYWWGEAHYRTTGGKLELTTIPEDEWKIIEDEAMKFWDEIAAQSPRNAKVVEILKKYQETMRKAGAPYRYG